MKNMELISILSGALNDYCGKTTGCYNCWLHTTSICGHDACDEFEEFLSALILQAGKDNDKNLLRTKESLVKEYKAGITGMRKRIFCDRFECRKCPLDSKCINIVALEEQLERNIDREP